MARPTTKLQGIERAAMLLFSQQGIAQVTIKDIAREADCAEGTLYRHYRSKEQMAWTLFSRETSQFGQRLQEVLMGPGTFAERAYAGVNTFYSFFDEDQTLFSFILLAQHDFPDADGIAPETNPNDLVIRFVREGIGTGAFHHPEPDLAAAMVMGLVLQPATMHIYGRLAGPLKNRTQIVSQACLRILGLKEE